MHIQVVDGDATPGHAPIGMKRDVHVMSQDLGQLYESRYCSEWVKSCAAVLSRVSVYSDKI